MKKALSLILVLVMCLCMCACAGETKSDEIELTLDNYDDYLKISPSIVLSHDSKPNTARYFDALNGVGCKVVDYSSYMSISVTVHGVSTNFVYSDITVEVRATGKYIAVDKNTAHNSNHTSILFNETFSQYIECDLDVSGKGRGQSTGKFSVPGGLVIPYHTYSNPSTDFSFEIVKISGTVKPAG